MASTVYATGEGIGAGDTTTLGDYLASFETRISSYSPSIYRMDSDSSNVKQSVNDAMLEVSRLPGATEWADSIFMDSSLWYALPVDFGTMARVSYKDPEGHGEVGIDSIIFSN